MTNPLLASDFIFNMTSMSRELNHNIDHVKQLMETVINDRAEYLREQAAQGNLGTKKRCTLLDTLLTAQINGQPMSAKDIQDEVHTFVFAGVDTTNAAMAFVLYALAKYTSEQNRIYEEIQAQEADINNMEYLDMFIKEVMRLYTIVPLTGRETTRDTVIGGRKYCAGMTLWVNMYGLAHDPELFENPFEFKPERFTKEATKDLPSFAYIPFSGGPHVCIGRRYALQIMKILTVKLLQSFHISLKNPDEELVLMSQMVLKSKNGVHIKFKPRQ